MRALGLTGLRGAIKRLGCACAACIMLASIGSWGTFSGFKSQPSGLRGLEGGYLCSGDV